jgi:hypothetical protein
MEQTRGSAGKQNGLRDIIRTYRVNVGLKIAYVNVLQCEMGLVEFQVEVKKSKERLLWFIVIVFAH